MKLFTGLVLSLGLITNLCTVAYTAEEAQKVKIMATRIQKALNYLQLNASCAQTSATILLANLVTSPEEHQAHVRQIKLYAEALKAYHEFLEDKAKSEVKQITQK